MRKGYYMSCLALLTAGCQTPQPPAIVASSTSTNVVWLGMPMVGMEKVPTNAISFGTHIQPFVDVSIEFGVREDGVVVWRRR